MINVVALLLRGNERAPTIDWESLKLLSDASRIDACSALSNLRLRLFRRSDAADCRPSFRKPTFSQTSTTRQPRKDSRALGLGKKGKCSGQHAKGGQLALVRVRPSYQRGQSQSSTISAGLSTLVGSPSGGSDIGFMLGNSRPHKKSRGASGPQKPTMLSSQVCLPSKAAKKDKEDRQMSWPTKTADSFRDEFTASPSQLPQKSSRSQSVASKMPVRAAMTSFFGNPGLLPATALEDETLAGRSISNTCRRRARKPTESFYSFTTDSTKLGEIPLHKWPAPYHIEATEHSSEAAYGGEGQLNGDRKRPQKRGLLSRIFQRRVSAFAESGA